MWVKSYHYVGQSTIRDKLNDVSNRHHVAIASQVIEWIQQTNQPKNPDDTITVTFIVDTDKQLWINDRYSEHVLCAQGGNVLSAGEITFEVIDDGVEIVAITNQSTGYCPEPESYPAVKHALKDTDILYPLMFTTCYHFRRCDKCGMTNIVKDDWFVCGVCDTDLSREWNF